MIRLAWEPVPRGDWSGRLDHCGGCEEFMTATDDATDWRARGACLSADPELFFPISSGGASERQEVRAKAVCSRCDVRAECLAFAISTRQVHGVWGGLGEAELARLRCSRPAPDGRPIPERIPGTGRVAGRDRGHLRVQYPEPSAR